MTGLTNWDEFEHLAPAGYYIAIRVGFAFPVVERNCLPATWVREYTVSGLIVHDPAMSWAYQNCGVKRFGDLARDDTQGVLELLKNHGLNFGAVASCIDEDDAGQRSFGFFFRSDRDYLMADLERLSGLAARRDVGAVCRQIFKRIGGTGH